MTLVVTLLPVSDANRVRSLVEEVRTDEVLGLLSLRVGDDRLVHVRREKFDRDRLDERMQTVAKLDVELSTASRVTSASGSNRPTAN